MRVWYTKEQTIQDLDNLGDGSTADSTTIRTEHQSIVALGAAGHAAMARCVDLVEVAGTDLYQVSILGTWGQRKIREFENKLRQLERRGARRGRSWGVGWALDKWDTGRDQVMTTYG
jgi:hypothetical protein